MKKKIVTLPTLDDVPHDAEFIGKEKEVTGYRFLVPVEQIEDEEPTEVIEPIEPFPTNSEFVNVKDGQFRKDKETVRFAGTNAYYLPTYENIDTDFVNSTWDMFEKAEVNLVRTWGFYDGPARWDGDPSFQTFKNGKAVYNEEGLRCLDRTVAKAEEKDIYLLIALVNYHVELGGYREYCKAVGVEETFTAFINSPKAQQLFREYIEMLLNRENTITGRKYKDEPIIMGWEIINEARNSNRKPTEIRDWYEDIAKFIKSIDSNHLVGTGEDGFEDITTGSWNNNGKLQNENYTVDSYSNTYVLRAGEGTSYLLNTDIPEIDFGSFHWYAIDYGFGNTASSNVLRAQEAWIRDHAKIADSLGKPCICGEYGFHVNWTPNIEVYSALWRISENVLDGTLLWQFVNSGPKRNEYGGNIISNGRTYNQFIEHINNMTK